MLRVSGAGPMSGAVDTHHGSFGKISSVAGGDVSGNRMGDALDGPEPPAGKTSGEIACLLDEFDEGVQPQRARRERHERLHERGRLVGEVVPSLTSNPRSVVARSWPAVTRWLSSGSTAHGTGSRSASGAGDDVPEGQAATVASTRLASR